MTKKLSTKEILSNNLNRHSPLRNGNVIVWAHNIRSMHNIGSIFRSADAFGISHIILSGYSPVPPRPEITKTAIGAEEFVNWSHYQNIDEVMEHITNDDYTLIGLEQTNDSVLLPDYTFTSDRKYCLVLGNEVSGIDDSILPHLHACVEIPQYGHKHSLNVSVAAGVLLYAVVGKLWSDFE